MESLLVRSKEYEANRNELNNVQPKRLMSPSAACPVIWFSSVHKFTRGSPPTAEKGARQLRRELVLPMGLDLGMEGRKIWKMLPLGRRSPF